MLTPEEQARFEELGKIPYIKRNGKEREEYRDLEGRTGGKAEAPKVEAKKEKTVSLTENELKNLIREVQDEARAEGSRAKERELGVGDWKEYEGPQKANKTARMRLWQKDTNSPLGLVVDWKWLRDDYDENHRAYDKQIYEVTVLYDDGETEKVEMPLLNLSQINNFETVEIIETQEKQLRKTYGKVRKATRNKEGYALSGHAGGQRVDSTTMGDYVDMDVIRVHTTHKIRRPNGSTLDINNDRLNA